MDRAIPLAGLSRRKSRERSKPAPLPAPRRLPVFINDAVTPYGGETLLLALLRAQNTDDLSRNRRG